MCAKANEAKGSGTPQTHETLDEIIAAYRAAPEFTERKPATQRDYRLWLTRISERWGAVPLEAFEDRRMRKDIVEWRNEWVSQPRTADKASVMMSMLLAYGLELGLLSINVAAGIKQLHHVNKSEQVWEDSHWANMADAPPHLMAALRLASLTGLRLGDLVRLDWSQVTDKAIIIDKTRKRDGRAVIPILPELRQLLDSLPHRSGAVLRNSKGLAWTESGLGSVFQKAKPAEFDRTIHDLRGTYVTWLAVKGLTDEQIARIVGWTARKVSQIRARYVDEARVVISLVDRLSA
jgi:integrase